MIFRLRSVRILTPAQTGPLSTWPASPPMVLPFLGPPIPYCTTTQPLNFPHTWAQHALFLFCPEEAKILLIFFHIQLKCLLFHEVICPPTALFFVCLFVWSLSSWWDRKFLQAEAVSCHLCVIVPRKSVCRVKQAFNKWLLNDGGKEQKFSSCGVAI